MVGESKHTGQAVPHSSYKGESVHSEVLSGSNSMEDLLGSQHWGEKKSFLHLKIHYLPGSQLQGQLPCC